VVLGGGGVERVIELDLLPEEEELFARSCADVRRQISLLPEEELCAGSR
jgi:malate/lactate dehydrogenase